MRISFKAEVLAKYGVSLPEAQLFDRLLERGWALGQNKLDIDAVLKSIERRTTMRVVGRRLEHLGEGHASYVVDLAGRICDEPTLAMRVRL